MTIVYLFQIDSAKENRHFFESVRDSSPGSIYFRGLDFKVGPWIPDGVRIDLEVGAAPLQCSLTLIELEAAESTALRSSRKYLHENSEVICNAFIQYLDRVVKDCNSRADSRELEIVLLMNALKQNVPMIIKTAAALRSSSMFLEESLLTDQASSSRLQDTSRYYIPVKETTGRREKAGSRQPLTRGILKLDPEQSMSLRRCILILDAIIQQRDHSRAIFHSWRGKAPLKRQLNQMGDKPPVLEQFILNQKTSGITIDFEVLLSELVDIWIKSGKKIDHEVARKLIDNYLPIATKIGLQDEMNLIFDAANLKIGSLLASQP